MRLLTFMIIGLLGLISMPTFADSLSREQVPEPLKPWVDWVLQDNDQLNCPYEYNQASKTCVWPSVLDLRLTEDGGFFSQEWEVYSEALVQLPGESRHWPQEVRSTAGELLVQSKNGQPFIKLDAGHHKISGRFYWQSLPKSLKVTPESGLITLVLNGQKIEQPRFNQQGQLWLTQGQADVASEDNIDIQVFRKIIDSHPVEVNTTIKLRVSGKQRNATLNSSLLKGFIARQIISPLPARLNSGGNLELQLRPGEWSIEVIGRAPTNVNEFLMPENQAPWPEKEVWVYQSDNAIRQAKVEGPSSIDPSQTQLPAHWKVLPAYLMSSRQKLELNVSHRGAADNGHDDLRLNRQMWLDYDGQGYTLKDQLTGELANPERLNVSPELQLGRVSIDGQDQFITYGQDESLIGVEIRRANVSMTAESRYTGERSSPPVNGWQQDLAKVSTTLHLPAGWRLFAANGSDNVPNSWLQSWSLLDLFLVLVIAISIAYLHGAVWAVFTLLCLVFIWQEPGAPRYIWLNLLVLTALLRALPPGRLRFTLSIYRLGSLIALLLILLPYTIDTIRVSLYPQLANGYYTQHRFADTADYERGVFSNEVMELEERALDSVTSSRKMPQAETYSTGSVFAPRIKSRINLNAIDPDSEVQTGFGLPSWQGVRSISLYWSGPVSADESHSLWLIGPTSNLIIRSLGILFLLVLSWRMTSIDRAVWPKPSLSFKSVLPLLCVMFLSPLMLLVPIPVQADSLPDQQMLQTLQSRLTQEPECLPDCAQIESMQLTIENGTLHLRLRIHAAIDTAIPLPGRQELWLPNLVLLDAEPANALQRDATQNLWIALDEGLHDVVLSGPLPRRNSVAIPLPLKPHHIQWRSLDEHWTLEGLGDDTTRDGQLQINRISQNIDSNEPEVGESLLPVFVRVERLITLGLDWNVRTTVRRVSPDNSPIGLAIPLLEGEQVLTESNGVTGDTINIALSSRQNTFSWTSRLAISESLTLTAANDPNYLEAWQLEVSPIWHIEQQGIPSSQTPAQNNSALTVWRPWPDETVQLSISRPLGVDGQSLTILSSQVAISPGRRANDIELTLNALSSRGVSHDIVLPDGVVLQSLTIAGQEQPVQLNNSALKLALAPGNQTVQVKWRDANKLGQLFEFPKLDLGIPSVNTWFTIQPPSSRWVVWVAGPVTGPAVLFWGVLLALFILALGLSTSKLTPLKTWQWFLLGVGLSQTETVLMVVVVGWLIAVAIRQKYDKPMLNWQFNLMQVALLVITVVALGVLAVAVGNGLLGRPDMQIVGNGSSNAVLSWYQDRSDRILLQPQVISVPMWVYRTLMLLWALWLAKSIIGWLRWEWEALNVGGLWKKKAVVQTGEDAPR